MSTVGSPRDIFLGVQLEEARAYPALGVQTTGCRRHNASRGSFLDLEAPCYISDNPKSFTVLPVN